MEITEKAKIDYLNIIHEMSHVQNHKARLAEYLAKQLSVILCEPDGEDSSGRQKLKLMSPSDVVTRCNDLADKFYEQWKERGWLVEVEREKK